MPDRTAPQWQPLWILFGAYLNQDMSDDYADAWTAAAAYREAIGHTRATSAATAARTLASDATDEEELRRAAAALGLEYDPTEDGYTYRGWLVALADFLETKR